MRRFRALKRQGGRRDAARLSHRHTSSRSTTEHGGPVATGAPTQAAHRSLTAGSSLAESVCAHANYKRRRWSADRGLRHSANDAPALHPLTGDSARDWIDRADGGGGGRLALRRQGGTLEGPGGTRWCAFDRWKVRRVYAFPRRCVAREMMSAREESPALPRIATTARSRSVCRSSCRKAVDEMVLRAIVRSNRRTGISAPAPAGGSTHQRCTGSAGSAAGPATLRPAALRDVARQPLVTLPSCSRRLRRAGASRRTRDDDTTTTKLRKQWPVALQGIFARPFAAATSANYNGSPRCGDAGLLGRRAGRRSGRSQVASTLLLVIRPPLSPAPREARHLNGHRPSNATHRECVVVVSSYRTRPLGGRAASAWTRMQRDSEQRSGQSAPIW